MPILPLNQREIKRDPDRERGPYENPWKEIEGTVRKVDEEKVKDCTEDIDTLLVFAGLYSAVLTAFLIESYKNLFADESETLLRQMVLQSTSYRFTNGYLNSTFDPSQLPTFKAAVSDIRVNVCWFASLILSLSSASFGIAVKQWLREFLAMDYISPQERLRIRDARIHGLADWKLFQIAAFLPILLQVSLVLFFVGLCFFTAAVHRSIGITSLLLVSCWAFLFFMSVLAPLFSPRCPYKTTILKVPFRYARPRVRAFFWIVYQRLAALSSHLRKANCTTTVRTEDSRADHDIEENLARLRESVNPQPLLSPAAPPASNATPPSNLWLRLRAFLVDAIRQMRLTRTTSVTGVREQSGVPSADFDMPNNVLGLPLVVSSPASLSAASAINERAEIERMPDNSLRSAWLRLAAFPTHLLRRLREGTPRNAILPEPLDTDSEYMHRGPNGLDYFDDYMDLGILSMFSAYVVDEDTVPEEEDTIRSTNTKDLIILWNIDTAFFDDSLLACMPQALSQRLPLLDVVRFVTTVVWHRSGGSFSAAALERPRRREWPWTLSPRARVALVGMLVESMEYELLRGASLDWSKLSRMDCEWSRSFTLLISLPPSRETIPRPITRLFEGFIAYYSKYRSGDNPYDVFSYQVRTLARIDPDWPARSLLFLAQSLTTLKIEDAEDCLRQITQSIFVKPVAPTEDTYRVLLERKPNDDYDDGDIIVPTPQTMVALLEVARVILHNVTLAHSQQDEFHERISVLLAFVFDAIPSIRKFQPDITFDKPLMPASDGPGLKRVLAGLLATPHTTRPLLHFFAGHSHFLSSLSLLDIEWVFLNLVEHTFDLSSDDRISGLSACTAFFMTQAASTPSASFIVDSLATLLRLCRFMHWYYPTAAKEEASIASWKSFFTAAHACYQRIVQHEPYLPCQFPGEEQHTELCEVAHNILDVQASPEIEARYPNEIVKVLRTFVCKTHCFSQTRYKFRLIKRLEEADAEQAKDVVEVPETRFNEAASSGRVLAEGTSAVAVHDNSIDNGLHGERSASPSEGPTEDAETIAGASGSHSVSTRRPSLSEPSKLDALSTLRVDAPETVRAFNPQGTAFATLPTDTDRGPGITEGERAPSVTGLRVSAVVPLLDDDGVGGNAPKLHNEDVEAVSLPASRPVHPTASKDDVAALSDM